MIRKKRGPYDLVPPLSTKRTKLGDLSRIEPHLGYSVVILVGLLSGYEYYGKLKKVEQKSMNSVIWVKETQNNHHKKTQTIQSN